MTPAQPVGSCDLSQKLSRCKLLTLFQIIFLKYFSCGPADISALIGEIQVGYWPIISSGSISENKMLETIILLAGQIGGTWSVSQSVF